MDKKSSWLIYNLITSDKIYKHRIKRPIFLKIMSRKTNNVF